MVRDFDFITPGRPQSKPASRPTPMPQQPKPHAPTLMQPRTSVDGFVKPVLKHSDYRTSHSTLVNFHPYKPGAVRHEVPKKPIQYPPMPHADTNSQPVPLEKLASPIPEKAEKTKKFLTLRNIIMSLLILVGFLAVASGLITPLLQNPHFVVLAYIPIALIFKLKSQISFTLALFFLILIPVLMVFKQEALAETYAVFCFYFLALGVIMAAVELRTSSRNRWNVK
jgi:hypothetical protein